MQSILHIVQSTPAVRAFKKDDYSTVASWWMAQNWPIIPFEALPVNGFIVDGVCAGWLYKTDSSICWMEWIVANPKAEKVTRNEALNTLVKNIVDTAKDLGFKSIFTSVANTHQKLLDRYESHGFVATDRNTTQMIRSL